MLRRGAWGWVIYSTEMCFSSPITPPKLRVRIGKTIGEKRFASLFEINIMTINLIPRLWCSTPGFTPDFVRRQRVVSESQLRDAMLQESPPHDAITPQSMLKRERLPKLMDKSRLRFLVRIGDVVGPADA